MPDLTRIIDALVALCRAVPGLQGIGVSLIESGAMFTLSVTTDEAVHQFAQQLGGNSNDIHYAKRDGHEWISAYISNPYISIHGPHRPVVEVEEPNAEALLARFALEIDLLFNDQIGFIEHAAMTARQTAVPVEVKQQLLREISEACRGRMPTWWPEMKAEIAEEYEETVTAALAQAEEAVR